MKRISVGLFIVFILSEHITAQTSSDSIGIEKEYIDLVEALKNPENVYRIDLSNQDLELSDTIWSKFTNLQYLSLKNDHLREIPKGIGNLKNLKVLDLSGNDFKILPSTFRNLTNLQELFLNDDKNLKFEKSISVLSRLPKLKSLHIENDGLKTLPKNISELRHLESLYLNDNEFKRIPVELDGLENLRYLDLHGNDFAPPVHQIQESNFGYKIRF